MVGLSHNWPSRSTLSSSRRGLRSLGCRAARSTSPIRLLGGAPMPHDDRQDTKETPFTISRRQVLGALGGASALGLLGLNPLRAGQGDDGGDEGGEAVSLDTRLVRDYGIRYP